ncbi:hypothetical protein CHS0354_004289 [Potamilus streckersoni]|uniref:G domain-containing protein n=1 Tax=Potamilus streckersoni TaxID=2493646 RepID=A0AAE0S4V2_9BIVA|nr:hypothetical protein CHS0354_004289 [Potamilus streckersoni]
MSDDRVEDLLPLPDYIKERKELLRRKKSCIQEIIQLCGTEPPLNVCVIGTYGAGKSSFINTIAAALSGKRWREYAGIGDYGGKRGVTTYVQRFSRCCQEKNARFAGKSLPNLIDIPGIQEDGSVPAEELLRIFFFGKLGHGDGLKEAIDYYSEHGIEGLKDKYSQNTKDENVYKISRIIFVASARQNLPENLIKSVVNAAQPIGSGRDRYKRTVPIFGVLTHAGPVERKADGDLENAEKQFMQSLGISRHRLLLCSNYCDDIDGTYRTEDVIPELDVPVLEFLVQVFDRSLSVLHDDETYKETQQRASCHDMLLPSDTKEQHGRAATVTPWYLTRTYITVIAVLFLAIMYTLLTKKG